MRVLVIGGTKFFGKLVVNRLLGRNDDVTVLTRGNERPAFLGQVRHIACDRHNHAEFNRLLRNEQFDVVFDNIAMTGEDVRSALQTFSGRIGHYILTSTVSVYNDFSSPRPLEEEDVNLREVPPDFDPNDPRQGAIAYAVGKRAAELVLWESEEEQRFPFTILRPSVVIGPEDPTGRFWFWVRRVQDGGPLLVRDEEAAGAFMLTYSEDLADVIVRVMNNPEAFGLAFNVVQDEVFTIETFLQSIAAAMGKSADIVRVPDRIVAQSALADYHIPAPTQFLFQSYPLRRYFSYVPQPISMYMKRSVDWYLNEYRGPEPFGYDRRAEEIALANRWRRVTL